MNTDQNSLPRSISDFTDQHIRGLYDDFDSPVTSFDCGKKCAPHNLNGKPFCCDICHAVPAVYVSEWKYLEPMTDLWREWCGDECGRITEKERAHIKADTPENMVLLACLGPAVCQRGFRALSCRQFPFFPYVTSDYRFIGLAYDWEFESKCWVISNLSRVTQSYRNEFISTYDRLFVLFQDVFDSYAVRSEGMRAEFIKIRRRIPLLHRNGTACLISPASERIRSIAPNALPKFGPYRG